MKKKTEELLVYISKYVLAVAIVSIIGIFFMTSIRQDLIDNDIHDFCESKLGPNANMNDEIKENGKVVCCVKRLTNNDIKNYCEVYEYVR